MAFFTVDAFPKKSFRGRISQIRNAAQTVQNVVTYNAVIDVDNDDLDLRPGMTATVSIVYATRQDVPSFPIAALRFHPPPEESESLVPKRDPEHRPSKAPDGAATTENRTLWIMKDGKPAPVPIKLGLSDGTYVEILEGEVPEEASVIVDVDTPTSTATAIPTAATSGLRRMPKK